jgi:hypothetical protein
MTAFTLANAYSYSDTVIEVANPADWGDDLYIFQFGACGTTWVAVWARRDCIEDALEIAAGWLLANAPGYLTSFGDAIKEAIAEFERQAGRAPDLNNDVDCERLYELQDQDCTYTDSGYLVSHEWYVNDASERERLLCIAACLLATLEDWREDLGGYANGERLSIAMLEGLATEDPAIRAMYESLMSTLVDAYQNGAAHDAYECCLSPAFQVAIDLWLQRLGR